MQGDCRQCNARIPPGSLVCPRCDSPVEGAPTGGRRRTEVEEGVGAPQQGYRPPPPQDSPRAAPQPIPPTNQREAEKAPRKTALDSDSPPPMPSGGFRPGPASPDPRAAAAPQPSRRGATMLDEPASSGDPSGPARSQRAARIVGWMISFNFNETGQEYVLREGRNVIGRSRADSVSVSLWYDGKVSEEHAFVIYRNGKCAVKDNASQNGTYRNGDDIGIGETSPVVHGDVLRFGDSTFKVFLLDPEEAARLWPSASK